MYPRDSYNRGSRPGSLAEYPARCYRQSVGAVKIWFPRWYLLRGVRTRDPKRGSWTQWLPACAEHFHARDWYLDHNGLTLAMQRGTLRAWLLQRARKLRRKAR